MILIHVEFAQNTHSFGAPVSCALSIWLVRLRRGSVLNAAFAMEEESLAEAADRGCFTSAQLVLKESDGDFKHTQ